MNWKSNTSKEVRSVKVRNTSLPSLYHLSFKDDLEGMWTPREPDGSDLEHQVEVPDSEKFPYPEPSITRISVGRTIEGCFIGIFPNVAKFFEEQNLPWMNFSVYSPIFKGNERIITNATLTDDRVVWDAVITGEYCILDRVYMERLGEIKVYNTNKAKTRMIHPFGDRKLGLESAGPETIRYEWVEGPKEENKVNNSLGQFV
jgi:hypothetical protein